MFTAKFYQTLDGVRIQQAMYNIVQPKFMLLSAWINDLWSLILYLPQVKSRYLYLGCEATTGRPAKAFWDTFCFVAAMWICVWSVISDVCVCVCMCLCEHVMCMWFFLYGQSLPFSRSCRSNLGLVLARLEELGYTVTTHRLRADNFGIPQRRCKLYFFGIRQVERMVGMAHQLLEFIPELLETLQCPLKYTPAPRRIFIFWRAGCLSDSQWLDANETNRH